MLSPSDGKDRTQPIPVSLDWYEIQEYERGTSLHCASYFVVNISTRMVKRINKLLKNEISSVYNLTFVSYSCFTITSVTFTWQMLTLVSLCSIQGLWSERGWYNNSRWAARRVGQYRTKAQPWGGRGMYKLYKLYKLYTSAGSASGVLGGTARITFVKFQWKYGNLILTRPPAHPRSWGMEQGCNAACVWTLERICVVGGLIGTLLLKITTQHFFGQNH